LLRVILPLVSRFTLDSYLALYMYISLVYSRGKDLLGLRPNTYTRKLSTCTIPTIRVQYVVDIIHQLVEHYRTTSQIARRKRMLETVERESQRIRHVIVTLHYISVCVSYCNKENYPSNVY